jgi:hypothetical protein
MIPTSFENEQELQRVLAENPRLLVAAIDFISARAQSTVTQLDDAARGALERALRTFAGKDGDGSVPAGRTPSPPGIRLVGSAASYRKPAVPAWRSSTQYQFVKRAGVWIETYREDPFAARSLIAARATETAPDPGRVQWDG